MQYPFNEMCTWFIISIIYIVNVLIYCYTQMLDNMNKGQLDLGGAKV